MKVRIFVISCLLAAIFLSGCKPTEKGYKAAYDAAINKRQAALADFDVKMPESELQEVDGMQIKNVDGVKVYVMNQRLQPVEENMGIPGNYNVVVGIYKMSTNCLSQVENLKEERLQAFAAKDAEGMYYSVAGSFPTLKDAVKFDMVYQKGKKRAYVGLHNAPVIVFSPK